MFFFFSVRTYEFNKMLDWTRGNRAKRRRKRWGGGGPLKLVVGILQRDEPLILFIAESRRKIQGPTSTPFRSFSDE
jgi:hypothetical protein